MIVLMYDPNPRQGERENGGKSNDFFPLTCYHMSKCSYNGKMIPSRARVHHDLTAILIHHADRISYHANSQ